MDDAEAQEIKAHAEAQEIKAQKLKAKLKATRKVEAMASAIKTFASIAIFMGGLGLIIAAFDWFTGETVEYVFLSLILLAGGVSVWWFGGLMMTAIGKPPEY